MPRNISFAKTTAQVRDRTKSVTRRPGWEFLKVGDVLNACVKTQGLKKGESPEVICQISVTNVRREPLAYLNAHTKYAFDETTAEGFPKGHEYHDPPTFVAFFCEAFDVSEFEYVTRIQFEYL